MRDEALGKQFDALAYSHCMEHVRSVTEAKKPETRAQRITRTVEQVRGDQVG